MINSEEKRKYIKWYRIAQKAVNNEGLIPDISDENIKELVSGENWLLLVSTEMDIEKAKSSPNPNIFIQIENKKMDIGIVFNAAPSIDKINNILLDHSKEQRKELIKLLNKLDDNYETTIEIKTKKNFAGVPYYSSPIKKIKSNKIDDKFTEELFKESERIRKEGKIKAESGLVQFEGPHIGLARIEIELDEEEFKKRIKEMIEIWKVCVSIKTDSQIRSVNKKEIKELEAMKRNIEDLISHGLHVDELKVKLKEVNEEIEKLKSEV